ncbi:hypothetical protein [Eisenbergiella porci]|uniref:hypothetical protein n=1 Tax=Eisenbergiella porci TaxID=2652274 RepID=UPI0020697D68|nr:hypothetical protein [Eisenbergiella porci]DAN95597.1 MAG TPA: hypothetical protein [Caudoviricetes sp.]
MAFKKKTWADRMVEYAGRRKLTNISTKQSIICDVERSEGTISKEGDAFSSQNMNDLEQRIEDGFTEVKQTTDGINQNLASGQIEFSFQDGKGVYRKKGADTWLPFSSTLVLMDGTGSYAFGGINNGYYSNFQLDNFDYSIYSKIRITNLGTYPFEVVCGTTSYTSPGTFDIGALKQTTLRIFYRGAAANPPILLKVELIP